MFHGLTIREYIKEHINHDTEYWQFGTGADYILSYLLQYSEKDWAWLSNEILNWRAEEIEILAASLAHIKKTPDDTDGIIRPRFKLFSQIFGNLEAAQAYDLLDDLLEFLEINKPELEKDSLQRIQIQLDNIKELFIKENQSQWLSEIQDKINSRIKNKTH